MLRGGLPVGMWRGVTLGVPTAVGRFTRWTEDDAVGRGRANQRIEFELCRRRVAIR